MLNKENAFKMKKLHQNPKKKMLVISLESLEQENKELSNQITNLESRLFEKKKESDMLTESSDMLKKSLMEFISEENSLLHEINFLDSEKLKLLESYDEVSEKYEKNISVLESMIKDVGFMKGEIGTLLIKTNMLEEEIPDKFRDAENLDKKIKSTFIRAITDLKNRINSAERQAKVLYYKKENI